MPAETAVFKVNGIALKIASRTFVKESTIDKRNIQRWIPIVAATQLTKENPDEEKFLRSWIDVIDFE
jgi:hypothetical protein